MSKRMVALSLGLVLILVLAACAVEPSHEADLAAPPPEYDFEVLPPQTDLAAPPPEDDVVAPPPEADVVVPEPEQVEPPPEADYPPDSALARTDADALFDAATIPVFKVTLSDTDWAWLLDDPVREQYVEANLTFEGEDIGAVGLRFRGAAGSLSLCVDDNGHLDTAKCNKLGLKIKFDFVDDDKRFFGLKRLNFMGMTRDPSKMVENLTYGIFRDMGIAAPRTGWAVLEVNGETQGLFSLIEQVDGRFTDDRWPGDGDGNLYKEVWPQTSNEFYYAGGLQNNEETATHEQFVAFYQAVVTAAPEDRLSALGEWTDLDYFYRYMAVQDAVQHWDGVTSIYCGEWGCGEGPTHNYYWYQHESGDHFTLIPWDVDSTMAPITQMLDWGMMVAYVPHWTVVPDDCGITYHAFVLEGFGQLKLKPPGCFPIFQALASDFDRYAAAVQELLDGPFNVTALSRQMDEYAILIRDAVAADPTLGGVQQWEQAVSNLRDNLYILVEQLELRRDGIPVNPDDY